MKSVFHEVIVIGAGPAGLSAAIEVASRGMSVAVFDENARPGGQMFKQTHKFFGSKELGAKQRGFNIAAKLLKQAEDAGVKVYLNSTVIGMYDKKYVAVNHGTYTEYYKADAIILATGAAENSIQFPGWTLPGVMGAGAAQTMMNLYGLVPGNRVLMVGSGNVGLVVSYQLMQAGVKVEACIDIVSQIGGYGVHAAKVARAGVPFLMKHTVVKAEGTDHVESAIVAEVDDNFKPIPGTETRYEVDHILLGVGLTPVSRLAGMAGCELVDDGGMIPVLTEGYETTIDGIFAAGDVAGSEEASRAMVRGKLAGIGAAKRLGYISEEEYEVCFKDYADNLELLRGGLFSPKNKGRTDITLTDEGLPLSKSLLQKGYLEEDDIKRFPGYQEKKGIHPVIECTQNIPCNPCQEACKFGCIAIGSRITDLPQVVKENDCRNCGMCVATCPGQAIFLVDNDCGDGFGTVTVPYEFLPLPVVGEKGLALGRDGSVVCSAEIVGVKQSPVFDKTVLLTMKVPSDKTMSARFYRREV